MRIGSNIRWEWRELGLGDRECREDTCTHEHSPRPGTVQGRHTTCNHCIHYQALLGPLTPYAKEVPCPQMLTNWLAKKCQAWTPALPGSLTQRRARMTLTPWNHSYPVCSGNGRASCLNSEMDIRAGCAPNNTLVAGHQCSDILGGDTRKYAILALPKSHWHTQ